MKRHLVRGSTWLAVLLLGLAGRAEAFDPGVTHAGMTERAALLSSLGRQLQARFGLAQGYFELLRMEVAGERGEDLRSRLARLDPAGGAAPDAGRLTALGWLVAGSILEEVPPVRGRHHFFDPSTGKGLDQGSAGIRVAAAASGLGTLRGVFTGAAFDGTGIASTVWLSSPDNDLGMGCFLEARRRAVLAPTVAERQSALAEALLCAGAMLHLVEDAGDPAHVHNDFRVSLYDDDAPLSRLVVARYGRLALPPPSGPARKVAHLVDLITAADGSGLADITSRSFYSEGLLPSGLVPPGVAVVARPGLPPLQAGPGRAGYLKDAAGHRLAHWQRDVAGMVAWTLDDKCVADAAAAVVPAAEQSALSALDHLLRGSLRFEAGEVRNGALGLGAGEVVLLAEDSEGRRRVVAEARTSGTRPGEKLLEIQDSLIGQPLIAMFHGADENGEPLVVSADLRHAAMEEPPPPKKVEPEPAEEESSDDDSAEPAPAPVVAPAPAPVAPVAAPVVHAVVKHKKPIAKHPGRRVAKKLAAKRKAKKP